jgi:thymidylate kinase
MLKINGKVTELKLKRILKYIKKDNKDNLTIIEIYGVDGAGKTFLVNKIKKKLKQKHKIKVFHLWNKKNEKNNKAIVPYKSKSYVYIISLIKEFYIIFRIIFFIITIFIFYKNKRYCIFERSLYDLVVDPERYRMSHKPFFIEMIYNFFFKDTKKIFLNIPYLLSKKRKNEISKKKYLYITNKLNNYFKNKT